MTKEEARKILEPNFSSEDIIRFLGQADGLTHEDLLEEACCWFIRYEDTVKEIQ